MSATEPDLPRDPAEYRPRSLAGSGVWAMVAFGVLCVLAGAAVALLAPKLLPERPRAPSASNDVATVAAPPPPAALPVVMASPAAEEVARLNARIAMLESQGARTTEAAAAALAAAQLVEASQGSRPFDRELAALKATTPGLPELAALTRLAQTGAPSRTALAASFAPYAAKAARRARKPPEQADLGQRIAYAAAKIVTVRRVDETDGATPDAILRRAELALEEGQVVAALKTLEALPPRARDALAPWREQAERRAQVDREVASLRARAVRALQAPRPPA
ncbi:MAG: hypothetical protein A2790_07615 [Phenylobacterium sp. RIFCSPHIGHO2_01_FULL_69_31]|uniref:COG4223 family protein n=1 Tax=Phenylobacterium sp. RIFCSPHIGHO2_01_FULL_69_31 TaxID=1801944 RepID=UPI0008CC3620|nr:hypothetical protein [Phenylobacterium sp. RIFCSPHIGHO2_01_FULL_69_31]OHB29762.1 MAG: hypothetical protein A2790_07615 [Phenylobacterium sp. RIFCSPHIGHO2_01_FULL_69_31]